MSFPDFSLIKFMPPGKQAQLSAPGEKTDLFKFFNAIVNKHSLEVDENQLEEIFSTDLSIDTTKYDKLLLGVLAEALIYFMTLWPGWEKSNDYYTGKIQCREWYEKFKNYLIIKTTHIINNSAKYMKKDKTKLRVAEVQADTLEWNGGKRIAPYVLHVGGPPNILNNLVFVETGGSIFVKQHCEKPWPQIQTQQLINWPYVIVQLELPDVSITRANTHQMPRYLALCKDVTIFPEVDAVKHVMKLPNTEDKALVPYSFEYFSSYFEQLIETLKLIPGILSARLLELETIFKEFLSDINEVNIHNHSFCPYLSVAFHIGKCKYVRNKKVSAGIGRQINEGINFYEIVIPEVDTSLNYFNAVQDETDTQNITFVSLNNLQSNLKDPLKADALEVFKTVVNNSVKYHCVLCDEDFNGPNSYSDLHDHFKEIHKCEQTLLCHKCRRQFEVQYLTSNRWFHECTG